MKIHFTTIWHSQKNFGKSINDFCQMIQDRNDWICVTDGDICFLTHEFGKQMEDVIKENAERFQLFGALTNRVGVKSQLLNDEFSNDFDMKIHAEIASIQEVFHYTDVKETDLVAGFLMLFPKWLWDKVKFQENTKHFDSLFCKEVKKLGYCIGIMQGVYVYHHYRVDHSSIERARFDSSHLDIKKPT